MAPSTPITKLSTAMEKETKPKGKGSKDPVAVIDNSKKEVDALIGSMLDKAQVLKGSRALLKHVEAKRKEKKANAGGDGEGRKVNLLGESDNEDEGGADESESRKVSVGGSGSGSENDIWLVLTTKKFITDKRKLKPHKIPLKYPLLDPTKTTACLIVKDPQRTYKDLLLPSSATVQKVIDITHLRKKYKTFESRRLLRDSYDIFLADDRIIPLLRRALGNTFLSRTRKIPIPVSIADKKSTATLSGEIESAVKATYVHLSPNSGTNIRVAKADSTPEQVMENVAAVAEFLVKKVVPGGWKGVRSLYVKTVDSVAVPVFLAERVFDEKEVKTEEDFDKEKAKAEEARKRKGERLAKRREKALKIDEGKKKNGDENAKETGKKEKKRKAGDNDHDDADGESAKDAKDITAATVPEPASSPAPKKQKVEKKAKKNLRGEKM